MDSFQVSTEEVGTRLDIFLAARLKISRKKAKQLIDQGRVFLGTKKIIIASWEVQAGEKIVLQESGETGVLPRQRRYLKVYYEDKDLLVVEKPPGVGCERTPQTITSTLVDAINDYLRRAHPDKPYPYVGLMHRLDRETSGLMVYTLSRRANKLALQFKRHSLDRRYLALVEGSLPRASGRIDRPVHKDLKSEGRKMTAGRTKGSARERAVTDYRVKERYPQATLVEARLLTGRTHQVRVHFAALGHPVLGDFLYGSRKKLPRQMLHASHLEFHHPVTGKKMIFHSELPGDFQKVLEKIRREELRLD
jgi:23S rRNA pseudouridine1911/1915/1917 synthase